jgi:uncharacterized protein (TIGR02757 family)
LKTGLRRIKELLDAKVELYNQPAFIENDPICIPHLFNNRKDIEIIGFWIAMLSWGQRTTIINKGKELCDIMDYAPYDFIMNAGDKDYQRLETFKHRTFNGGDALSFASFFRWYYQQYETLESVFIDCDGSDEGRGIAKIKTLFLESPDFLPRTKKHIASPCNNSSCKRINMFLRWMVRKDERGVDFGLWHQIDPKNLMIPLDVHVHRVATNLGLLTRKQADWKSVVELTKLLRIMDSNDPVRYDYALFGMGIKEKSEF